MLVLRLKRGEAVSVGNIAVRVIAVKGNTVKLGFAGPQRIAVLRDGAKKRERRVPMEFIASDRPHDVLDEIIEKIQFGGLKP